MNSIVNSFKRMDPVRWILLVVLVAIVAFSIGRCTAPEPPAIIESSDLAVVERTSRTLIDRYGTKNVLVIYDLDNTLLAMEQGLGSDQWYTWQKNLAGENPCHEELVADRLAVQGALYHASAMRLTQPDADDIVRNLQILGIPVMAITSRGPGFRLPTFRELRRNGLDFEESAPGPEGGYQQLIKPQSGSRDIRYEDGVLFTAGQHKGQMLAELLELTETRWPRALIIADDKMENLQNFAETAAENDVPLYGFHYQGEAEQVAGFDTTAANQQWQRLWQALLTVQQEFGPDNFQIPESQGPVDCQLVAPEAIPQAR